MSNNNKESAKTNGTGSDPLQRLATLKTPRDLTLGGTKPNKKIFTPNLNVSRNKNKAVVKPELSNQKKENRNKNDRNKNVRNGPNVIKSSGIFSQGLGQVERPQRQGYERSESTSSALPKPKISVKDFVKIDKELEEKKIKAVLGDYSLDSNIMDSFRNSLSLDAPIRLPIDEGFLQSMKKRAKELKQTVIKKEPSDEEAEVDPLVDLKMDVYEDTDIVNLLRSDQPTMVLLQLPETLPGRGGKGGAGDGPRRAKTDDRPSTSSGESQESDTPKEERCYLEDLDEGRIATIRIHRSGRVTMAFGDTVLDVSSGTKTSFFQEVISLTVDEQSRSANLLSLGPLVHRVITEPDWASLISAV